MAVRDAKDDDWVTAGEAEDSAAFSEPEAEPETADVDAELDAGCEETVASPAPAAAASAPAAAWRFTRRSSEALAWKPAHASGASNSMLYSQVAGSETLERRDTSPHTNRAFASRRLNPQGVPSV